MNSYLSIVNGLVRRFSALVTGAGSADAGKLIATNASGLIDNTLLPTRRAGCIVAFADAAPAVGYFLDFDGYWVVLTSDTIRTIGNPSSGASIAQNWTLTLFTLLWSTYNLTDAPLITSAGMGISKGASALEDWNANNRITLPDFRGRSIIGAGTGASLTARTKNQSLGSQTATLSTANLPAHTHSFDGLGSNALLRTPASQGYFTASTGAGSADTTASATASTGSGSAFSIMPPSRVENLIISAGAR